MFEVVGKAVVPRFGEAPDRVGPIDAVCRADAGWRPALRPRQGFDEPSQVKAFTTMADLYKAGAGLDVGTDNNNAVTAFAAGKTAMMFNSSAVAASVAQSTSFAYEALPFPLSAPARCSLRAISRLYCASA